jgi:hypothetical protein
MAGVPDGSPWKLETFTTIFKYHSVRIPINVRLRSNPVSLNLPMRSAAATSPTADCTICRKPAAEWLLRLTVEDAAGFRQEAYICPNCAVKLRLASEKHRDLQIDPWVHDAVARVLRGKVEE